MRKILSTIICLSAGLLAMPAQAQEFFDTSECEDIFTFGVRTGLNTSVSSTSKNAGYNIYNHNSWGLGFDLGVVANINIREFLSLQPGFFYQTRSGDFTYVSDVTTAGNYEWGLSAGHIRRYIFNVPIMAAFHFNLGEDVKWNVDFGPYFDFNLKTDINDTYIRSENMPAVDLRHKGFDFGFKMGTGFKIMEHYVVAVHYLAGTCKAWKDPMRGGRNKTWTFTIGYDF